MKQTIFAKNALLPEGMRQNIVIAVEDGVITAVGKGTYAEGMRCVGYAAPGLLDVHIHGGWGFSVQEPDLKKYEMWLTKLAENGVAGVLAGVYTAPLTQMRAGVEAAAEVMKLQKEGKMGGARLVGVHLEGPFISRNAPGAMDVDHIYAPTVENYRAIVGEHDDIIRLVAIAPEEEGAIELAKYLTAKGIRISAGHTAATDAQAKEAFDNGFGCVTHTFNASTKIHHRAPGLIAEALTRDDVYCECITDFMHVYPTAVKLIYHCKGKDRFVAITDCVETGGLADGQYDGFYIKGGAGFLPDGTLNGSGISLDRGVRNLMTLGLSAEEALTCASVTPAKWLGISFGTIAMGNEANLSLFDEDLMPLGIVAGK